MTDAQESMVKAKLKEIADAIPECKGAVFAISTGKDIAATMKKQLDKELEEVIGGGNKVS